MACSDKMPEMQAVQGATAKMPAYIGTKIICAVPMGERAFLKSKGREVTEDGEERDGYRVVYPDGYESWSPKETFEAAYRLVSDDERKMV